MLGAPLPAHWFAAVSSVFSTAQPQEPCCRQGKAQAAHRAQTSFPLPDQHFQMPLASSPSSFRSWRSRRSPRQTWPVSSCVGKSDTVQQSDLRNLCTSQR